MWAKYRGRGFLAVAVNVGSHTLFASKVHEQNHLTMPMALDLEEAAFSLYRQLDGVTPLFPLNVLVGKDGRILRIITDPLDYPMLDAMVADALSR